MKTLRLTHDKLECLPVELDEFGEIHILTPTKGVFSELVRIVPATQALAGKKIDPEIAEQTLSDIYTVCANILSRNLEHKILSAEDVERVLMISDIIVFIQAYVDFITETAKAHEKN